MEKIDEYLSQSKYAEHRSVTKGYIGRLVKEGRLHLIKVNASCVNKFQEVPIRLTQN